MFEPVRWEILSDPAIEDNPDHADLAGAKTHILHGPPV
jgi:hypothetical protein